MPEEGTGLDELLAAQTEDGDDVESASDVRAVLEEQDGKLWDVIGEDGTLAEILGTIDEKETALEDLAEDADERSGVEDELSEAVINALEQIDDAEGELLAMLVNIRMARGYLDEDYEVTEEEDGDGSGADE